MRLSFPARKRSSLHDDLGAVGRAVRARNRIFRIALFTRVDLAVAALDDRAVFAASGVRYGVERIASLACLHHAVTAALPGAGRAAIVACELVAVVALFARVDLGVAADGLDGAECAT